MKYEIIGSSVPVVEFELQKDEKIFSQSGGLAWMDQSIEMDTNMRGGIAKSLTRMFGGESIFMSTFRATQDSSRIAFASGFVGDVLPMDVSSPIIVQKTAFLCAQDSVQLNMVFTKKISSGLFGGEGFVLQKLSGTGLAFLEVDGNVREIILQPGQVLKVDSGHIAAFEESVSYEIQVVNGVKNMLFGGEGIFFAVLRGPGKVWLQTMNIHDLANKIIPYIPVKTN